jgi:hypothetical protein
MNVGRLTVPRNPLITEVDSVRSGMDLSGTTEGERRTAGGTRTGEGVLKVSLESQFNKFVWNHI